MDYEKAKPMKIYADNCCFKRAFDKLIRKRKLQRNVIEQADAFAQISGYVFDSPDSRIDTDEPLWGFVDSEALRREISKCKILRRRQWVEGQLASLRSKYVKVLDDDIRRQGELLKMRRIISRKKKSGLRAMDALHLALAESARADIFLTTDKRLHDWCQAMKAHLKVPVAYPQEFLSRLFRNYGINTYVVGPQRLQRAAKIKAKFLSP